MKKQLFMSFLLASLALPVLANEAPAPQKSWAAYHVYAEDNKKIEGPVDAVFMGDSITEGWFYARKDFFEKNRFFGRGIGGQTTYQMLARFQEDVVKLAPQCVLILAGTNDVAQNMGYISTEQIAGNIKSMCEMARQNDIQPIICSVLPVYEYNWNKQLGIVAETIKDLNRQLKEYADANDIIYVDFHSAMRDDRDGLPADLSGDGVHVLDKGYAIMESMVLPIISEVTASEESRQ